MATETVAETFDVDSEFTRLYARENYHSDGDMDGGFNGIYFTGDAVLYQLFSLNIILRPQRIYYLSLNTSGESAKLV
jgi:hypothetical protein